MTRRYTQRDQRDEDLVKQAIIPPRICAGCEHYDECFFQPPKLKECSQYRGSHSALAQRYTKEGRGGVINAYYH